MKENIKRMRKGKITTVTVSLKIKRISQLLSLKIDIEIAQARELIQRDLKAENVVKRTRNLQCIEVIKAGITLALETNIKAAVTIIPQILIVTQ